MGQCRGVVKWFSDVKGYGFLGRNGASDVFVHFTAIQANGYRSLREGDSVSFDVIDGERGPQAENVQRMNVMPPPTEMPQGVARDRTGMQGEVA